MTSDTAGLIAGLLALAVSLTDSIWEGKRLDKLTVPLPAANTDPALSAKADDELQALRMQVEGLNGELLGLKSGYITTWKQLDAVVGSYFQTRDRRVKVHRFATRSREVRIMANDWAKQIIVAYKLSGDDAEQAKAIMKKLAEDLEQQAKSTGGEPELEGRIAALFDGADEQLKGLLSDEDKKRYRAINRGWSSGLVGNPEELNK